AQRGEARAWSGTIAGRTRVESNAAGVTFASEALLLWYSGTPFGARDTGAFLCSLPGAESIAPERPSSHPLPGWVSNPTGANRERADVGLRPEKWPRQRATWGIPARNVRDARPTTGAPAPPASRQRRGVGAPVDPLVAESSRSTLARRQRSCR